MRFHSFKVPNLISAEVGTEEEHDVQSSVEDLQPDDPKILEPLALTVNFLKAKDRIEADLSEFDVSVEITCSRCLKKVVLTTTVPASHYTYLLAGEEITAEEKMDNLWVDLKNNLIDISEPLRNETLLAIGEIPLCKEDCRGLCPLCGKDLNEGQCRCKRNESSVTKNPFEKLKKVIS